jgi:hypothetical protein
MFAQRLCSVCACICILTHSLRRYYVCACLLSVCAVFAQCLRRVCAVFAQCLLSVCTVFVYGLCSVCIGLRMFAHVCAELVLRLVIGSSAQTLVYIFACLRIVCAYRAQTQKRERSVCACLRSLQHQQVAEGNLLMLWKAQQQGADRRRI